MKLTPQEEYGLRCLLQVARNAPCPAVPPVPIEKISMAESLGYEHTAKMMRLLRRGGLVSSTRGARGGFHLARPPDQITVWEVLVAMDPPLYSESFCDAFSGQADNCAHATGACNLKALWQHIGNTLQDSLSTLTLADLLGGEAWAARVGAAK